MIFHVILSIDALRLRNMIQVFGLLIFQAGLIVYGAIQVQETKTGLVTNPGADCSNPQYYATCSGPGSLWYLVEPFQIVVPAVLGVSWVILIYCAWHLYSEFGWFVFRVVGADPKLKSMFEYYQVMLLLLKFDYFAFIGLTMQLLILVLSNETAQYAVTIAAIPIVLVLLIGCGIAVVREIRWLMICSLVLLLASQAYFIYKFTRLFVPRTRHLYDSTRKTVGVFLIGASLLVFATFWVGLKCMLDFDRGLRASKMSEPTMFTSRRSRPDEEKTGGKAPTSPNGAKEAANYFSGGEPLQQRISIE